MTVQRIGALFCIAVGVFMILALCVFAWVMQ